MSYKIAVGSNDNKSVNQHFGTSEGFGIYIVDDDGGYKYSEYRKTVPLAVPEKDTTKKCKTP